jgi:NAD(P)-dependent dehydrogenase (short-subunit alcohol dehydrogenase family)
MKYPTVQELFDLNGQVALVTGGARNLGLQIAEALAEVGAAVVVTARKHEAASRAAEQLAQAKGTRTLGVQLEITDEAAWTTVVQQIEREFGRLDILVNNAGGRDARPAAPQPDVPLDVPFLEERSLAEWQRMLDVNLTSVFLGCRAVVPMMKKQGAKLSISLPQMGCWDATSNCITAADNLRPCQTIWRARQASST